MIYLSAIFFVFILLGVCWAFRNCELMSFINFESFQAIFCSNISSTLFSLPPLLLRFWLHMSLSFGIVSQVSDTLFGFFLLSFSLWFFSLGKFINQYTNPWTPPTVPKLLMEPLNQFFISNINSSCLILLCRSILYFSFFCQNIEYIYNDSF